MKVIISTSRMTEKIWDRTEPKSRTGLKLCRDRDAVIAKHVACWHKWRDNVKQTTDIKEK